jgi:MFS transporter, PHS family, inorganic phosphate transporter
LSSFTSTVNCSFTDAYQLFVVSFACVMFGYVYYPNEKKLPTSAETAIKLASSVGTVIGQISFGIFSDLLGRKKVALHVH